MSRLSASLRAAASVASVLALGGCSSGPDDLRTLAKVDDWRQGLSTPDGVFSALEVAYDAETAQRLWDENVQGTLPVREGGPAETGVYGDLADVDFDDQVVALWSSGQSGSCPRWLSDVRLDEAGAVVVSEDVDTGGQQGCSDDRHVYRTVVVLDRSAVPDQRDLSAATATDDDASFPARVLLAAYPAS